eukprot:92109-Prorocentrum_minimum.AAC.1
MRPRASRFAKAQWEGDSVFSGSMSSSTHGETEELLPFDFIFCTADCTNVLLASRRYCIIRSGGGPRKPTLKRSKGERRLH